MQVSCLSIFLGVGIHHLLFLIETRPSLKLEIAVKNSVGPLLTKENEIVAHQATPARHQALKTMHSHELFAAVLCV